MLQTQRKVGTACLQSQARMSNMCSKTLICCRCCVPCCTCCTVFLCHPNVVLDKPACQCSCPSRNTVRRLHIAAAATVCAGSWAELRCCTHVQCTLRISAAAAAAQSVSAAAAAQSVSAAAAAAAAQSVTAATAAAAAAAAAVQSVSVPPAAAVSAAAAAAAAAVKPIPAGVDDSTAAAAAASAAGVSTDAQSRQLCRVNEF